MKAVKHWLEEMEAKDTEGKKPTWVIDQIGGGWGLRA